MSALLDPSDFFPFDFIYEQWEKNAATVVFTGRDSNQSCQLAQSARTRARTLFGESDVGRERILLFLTYTRKQLNRTSLQLNK